MGVVGQSLDVAERRMNEANTATSVAISLNRSAKHLQYFYKVHVVYYIENEHYLMFYFDSSYI